MRYLIDYVVTKIEDGKLRWFGHIIMRERIKEDCRNRFMNRVWYSEPVEVATGERIETRSKTGL